MRGKINNKPVRRTPNQARPKLDTKIIHSLDKGLQVLELVAANGEPGLSELNKALKWDKSTIFRLLTTLIRRGFVEQDKDTKRYRLGYRILHLERQLFRSLDLPRLARDVLTWLANETGEAAHLAVLHDNQVVIVAQREGPGRVAANAQVGTAEPLHCTALGKAMLMQLSDEALKNSLQSMELKSYTAKTITSLEWLLGHIQKARQVGYAVDEEEFDPEVRCIAAPAIIPASRQFYALGISGPSSRMSLRRMPELAEQVLSAAERFKRRFAGEAARSGE